MKRILQIAAIALMTAAIIACFSGCGTSPLAKAYDDLYALMEQGVTEDGALYGDVVDTPLQIKYNENLDALILQFDSTTDLDKVFDILYDDLNGKDIGTIAFYMDGTRGDGFEARLNKKMAKLDCSSIEMLGVDWFLTDSDVENHDWTKLAEKTEKLLVNSSPGLAGINTYSNKELKRLESIKELSVAHYGSEALWPYTYLKNVETISLVDPALYGFIDEEGADATTGKTEAGDTKIKEFNCGQYSAGMATICRRNFFI